MEVAAADDEAVRDTAVFDNEAVVEAAALGLAGSRSVYLRLKGF